MLDHLETTAQLERALITEAPLCAIESESLLTHFLHLKQFEANHTPDDLEDPVLRNVYETLVDNVFIQLEQALIVRGLV